MLAGATKTPELALDNAECQALAAALAEVQSHYDAASRISPEMLAWGNLALIAGQIYGFRAVAILNRKRRHNNAPDDAQHGTGGAFDPQQPRGLMQ